MNRTILTLPEDSYSVYGRNVFVARQVHQNVTSLKPVGSSRLILGPSILNTGLCVCRVSGGGGHWVSVERGIISDYCRVGELAVHCH